MPAEAVAAQWLRVPGAGNRLLLTTVLAVPSLAFVEKRLGVAPTVLYPRASSSLWRSRSAFRFRGWSAHEPHSSCSP